MFSKSLKAISQPNFLFIAIIGLMWTWLSKGDFSMAEERWELTNEQWKKAESLLPKYVGRTKIR